jgi:AraC family transcriptional regulator
MIATQLVTRAVPRGAAGSGPRHANGWCELSIVTRGAVTFTLDAGAPLVLRRGEVGVLGPWVENTPHVRGVVVHQLWFDPALLGDAAEAHDFRRPDADPRRYASDGVVAAIARAYVVAEREGATLADPAQRALFDALVLALVAPTRRERPDPGGTAIRRALDRIAADLDAPLTVDALAADAGMSRFAFHRAFQRATGESPYRYLIARRLDAAAHLLRTTRQSVLEIALQCGFMDPGRFARAFRARFGVTPRAYRT